MICPHLYLRNEYFTIGVMHEANVANDPTIFCSEVRVTGSLVFYVMFCISLFVLLSMFWLLYCMSFNVQIMITHLISSTRACRYQMDNQNRKSFHEKKV